jgi:hypothetical protein
MINGVYCLDINNFSFDHPPDLDVVFVHGIASNAESAWTNANGDLWPLWLKPMLPSVRVVLLNYPAPLFFGDRSSGITIKERARNLADFLPTIGIGIRPTVFICHSLGGVIIKEVIRSCIETGCSLNVALNTVGIIFLATPHAGSKCCNWIEWIGSALAADLALNSEYLVSLRDWFSSHALQSKICISAYYETQTYKNVIVVHRDSADPHCQSCNAVAVDADHCNIVKPISPSSDTFIRIRRDIEDSRKRIEAMSSTIKTIDDILLLPDLTNKMYFDIVNFLYNAACTPNKP